VNNKTENRYSIISETDDLYSIEPKTVKDWFNSKSVAERDRLMNLSAKKFGEIFKAENELENETNSRITSIDPLTLRNRLLNMLNKSQIRKRVFDDVDNLLNTDRDPIHLEQALEKLLKDERHYTIRDERSDQIKFAGLKKIANISHNATKFGYKNREFDAEMERWFDYNLQAINFIGQYCIDHKSNKPFTTWMISHGKELKDLKVYKDTDGDDLYDNDHYIFFLTFPNMHTDGDRCTPYSYAVSLHKEDMPTIQEVMLGKFKTRNYADEYTKTGAIRYFWSVGSMLDELSGRESSTENDAFELYPYDLSTIQDRFKYVRKNLCGISQNFLANLIEKEWGDKADQKKIDYWEKSTSAIPPLLKNRNLHQAGTVFADNCEALLSYEMKDTENKFPSNRELKYWIMDYIMFGMYKNSNLLIPEFISKNVKEDDPNIQSFDDYSSFIEIGQLVDEQYSDMQEKYHTNFHTRLAVQVFVVTRAQTMINELKQVYPKEPKTQKEIFSLYRFIREHIISDSAFINRSRVSTNDDLREDTTFRSL